MQRVSPGRLKFLDDPLAHQFGGFAGDRGLEVGRDVARRRRRGIERGLVDLELAQVAGSGRLEIVLRAVHDGVLPPNDPTTGLVCSDSYRQILVSHSLSCTGEDRSRFREQIAGPIFGIHFVARTTKPRARFAVRETEMQRLIDALVWAQTSRRPRTLTKSERVRQTWLQPRNFVFLVLALVLGIGGGRKFCAGSALDERPLDSPARTWPRATSNTLRLSVGRPFPSCFASCPKGPSPRFVRPRVEGSLGSGLATT